MKSLEKDRTKKALAVKTFRIDLKDAARLRVIAQKTNRPYSALIREAVVKLIAEFEVA